MRVMTGTSLAALLLSAAFASAQSTPAAGASTNSAMSTTDTASSAMSSMSTTSGNPAAEASLQKIEQELTEAFSAKNTAPFQKYLDDNVGVVMPGRREQGKAKVIQGISAYPCTANRGSTSDFSYRWLSPDSVLVTYMYSGNETCQGKQSPVQDFETSLWQKKNGGWVNLYHQSTPATPAMPAGS